MSNPPETVTAPDGTRYYAPSVAATRIGRSPRQIDTLVNRDVGAADYVRSTQDPEVLDLHRGHGRPPSYLVAVDDIERIRQDLLRLLEVDEEPSALQSELANVRVAWEQEVLSLTARLAAVEGRTEDVLAAVEMRFNAAMAQLDADRAFIRALRDRPDLTDSEPRQ